MADPFVAEIRIFPFNFAPKGWAWCDGQLLPVTQNTALFSLLGVKYGGDGKSNFALPNLQGRAPMHPNDGGGLTLREIGEMGGTETVTLSEQQMPVHSHFLRGDANVGESPDPSRNSLARGSSINAYQTVANSNLVKMAAEALPYIGAGQPHSNMQPYLTLYFCIALQGVFPQRS